MDLTNPPDYGPTHDSAVENLRKNLEAKEIFTHKYKNSGTEGIYLTVMITISDFKSSLTALSVKRLMVSQI